jgi:hypothetical protein
MERTAITKLKWTGLAVGCLCAATAMSTVIAQAQPAPAVPPPAVEPMPATPSPAAPTTPPATAAPEPMPAAPPPIAEPLPPPVVEATPPPEEAPATDDETMAHAPMGIHAWGRVGSRLQNPNKPKKLNHLNVDGDLELHFDGNATKEIGITGNVAAVFPPTGTDSTVSILDLIARFDIVDPFHIWAGRMLVPSDRANFSGTWFEAPWYYPGTFSLSAGGHGFVGPHEGAYGRNDGVTVWGQAAGGLFKYYVGAFELDSGNKPLWTGRLNLSLLNPEPGYYHSSTYYGKDILAIAIGGQVQKNGSAFTPSPTTAMPSPVATKFDDYALFNADILFEKNLKGSGVLDLEGAFYKYVGDFEPFKYSYLLLASYLIPGKVGPGQIQPLVRWQSAKAVATDKMDNSIEVQLGYPIAMYDARLALGFQHTDNSGVKGNGIYLGAQILK